VSCPETILTLDQIYEAVEPPPLQVGEPEIEPVDDAYVTEQ
jgi:hypothetical protein